MDLYSGTIGPAFQFLFLALFIVPGVLFVLTLQKTLSAISQENRKMSPSNVWLLFVPIFNLVWQFIMVDKIAQSISAECAGLNIPVKVAKPTYNSGLAWSISNILFFIPVIGSLAALITFILYWVKVNEYKNLIIANKNNYMLDAERNIFHGDKLSL